MLCFRCTVLFSRSAELVLAPNVAVFSRENIFLDSLLLILLVGGDKSLEFSFAT